MVSGTEIVDGSAQQFASAAGDAADRITGMLSQLMNGLAPLESSWKGLGGSSFQQVKATVEQESTKLSNALHGLGADMGIVGQTYDAADSDQKGKMDQANATTTGITAGLSMGSSA